MKVKAGEAKISKTLTPGPNKSRVTQEYKLWSGLDKYKVILKPQSKGLKLVGHRYPVWPTGFAFVCN